MCAIIFCLFCLCFYETLGNDNERYEKLEGVISEILENFEEKEARINQFENIVQTQSETITNLEKKISDQEHSIQSLQENIEIFEKVKENVERTDKMKDAEKHTQVKTFKDGNVVSNQQQRKQSRIRRAENETPVAFLATLSQHLTQTGAMQVIVFDHIITNVGVAYNPHGGIFIAPVSGIYVFSATLMAHSSTSAHFGFLKNGSIMTRLFHYTESYGSTSMQIVLELAIGDDVVVANVDQNEELNGSGYTSFSGFLLQEYYPDSSVVG